MSQNGASGKPILARCNFSVVSISDDGNTYTYHLGFRLSEPYANGGEFDGERVGDTSNTTDIEPTDSEIIAMNKDICAAWIANRYNDPTFTAADLRGGDII
jgi:hypothetical protein